MFMTQVVLMHHLKKQENKLADLPFSLYTRTWNYVGISDLLICLILLSFLQVSTKK